MKSAVNKVKKQFNSKANRTHDLTDQASRGSNWYSVTVYLNTTSGDSLYQTLTSHSLVMNNLLNCIVIFDII